MQREEFDHRLNSNIPGSADNVSACFLNKIYVRESNNDIYEIALVDDTYTTVQLMRVNDLHDICDFIETRDFSLDDDYLLCNPNVITVPGDSITDINTIVGEKCDDSIFSFIIDGVRNNYVVIDDSVISSENSDDCIFGISYFRNIKFAETTFSIYLQMVNESGIYNKMLVTEENNRLTFHPFYFGVPAGQPCMYGSFKDRRIVNNIEYDVYYIDFLPVLNSTSMIVSAPVINSAMQQSEKFKFCILALSDLMHDLYVVSESNVEWAGGNNNYTSAYTIQFKSTMRKISKRARTDITDSILHGACPIYAEDERVKLLHGVLDSLNRDKTGMPTLDSLNTMVASLKTLSVFSGAYIASLRYYLYCSHKSIRESIGATGTTILYGGNSEFGTIVEEGF